MAQDSIAYGESLLADIRKRNDKAERRAKKDARKGEWKALAVDIGMNVANDIFATRRNELLNNENSLRQKMEITSANTFATDFSNQMEEATKYVGGEQAYWQNDFNTIVDKELSKKFLPNQRNELQYRKLLQATVDKNFKSYYNQVKKKQKATEEFLYKGAVGNYNLNMKKITGDGTAKNALARTISKLTGNLDLDVYESRNEELQRASTEYQTTYVDTFARTQDEMLATAVAELGENAAGVPSPKLGEAYTQKNTDLLGNETEVRVTPAIVSQRNKDGDLVQKTVALVLGPNGYEPYTNAQQRRSFDLASIGGSLNTQQVTRGKILYSQLPEETISKLSAVWNKQILLETGGDVKPGDMGHNDFFDAKRNSFIRTMVASGVQAYAEEWGTENTGQKVYVQAALDRIEGTGGVANIGNLNAFDTMFAMDTLSKSNGGKGVINGKTGMRLLANKPTVLYEALEGMGSGARANLFKRLAAPVDDGGVNYFEGNLNEKDFESDMLAFKYIFQNQTVFNRDNFDSIEVMLATATKHLADKFVRQEVEDKDIEERRQARIKKLQQTLSITPTL